MAITKPPIATPWATDPTTQADSDLFEAASFMEQGYTAPGGNPEIPALGHFNWVFWWVMTSGRYHQSVGIPGWDATETEYTQGSVVRHNGGIWACVDTPSTGVSPSSDLTNWQLWVDTPIGIAEQWARKIWSWKNAQQQIRSHINHLGHIDDRLIRWREHWRGNDDQNGAGSQTFEKTVERWSALVVGSGSRATVRDLASMSGIPTPVLSKYLQLLVGIGATDLSQCSSEFQGTYTDYAEISVDMDTYIVDPSNHANFTFGLGSHHADNAGMIGAVFEKKATDTNWFAVCGNGSALSARVNTGVPVTSAGDRMRVEWLGANVADDGVAAARFYIADTLVATITSNLPSAAATPRVNVFLGAKRLVGSSGSPEAFVGPLRYAASYSVD